MKHIFLIIGLVCILATFSSCQVTDTIPSGVWVCEEEDISLFLVYGEQIALYKGDIATVDIGYKDDISIESLPPRGDIFPQEYVKGSYKLKNENTLKITSTGNSKEEYTFKRQQMDTDDIKGRWKSDDIPLEFSITESNVSIATKGDGELASVFRTPQAPYIWCVDPYLGYNSQKSLLFFGEYSLQDDSLVIRSLYGGQDVVMHKVVETGTSALGTTTTAHTG